MVSFVDMFGGISVVLFYSDGELFINDKVKFEVVKLIREYKFDVLIIYWKNLMYKDYEVIYYIVKDV